MTARDQNIGNSMAPAAPSPVPTTSGGHETTVSPSSGGWLRQESPTRVSRRGTERRATRCSVLISGLVEGVPLRDTSRSLGVIQA